MNGKGVNCLHGDGMVSGFATRLSTLLACQ